MAGDGEPQAKRAEENWRARGREAAWPQEMTRRGWKEIMGRTWRIASGYELGVIAAGVAFFALLALFPAMSAAYSLYGLAFDPQAMQGHVAALSDVLPDAVRGAVMAQLQQLAQQAGSQIGLRLGLSLAIALWSAAAGAKSLMTALNFVYHEEEKRGFIAFSLTALALTLLFILLLFAAIALVIAVPAVIATLGLDTTLAWVVDVARWPILAVVLLTALVLLNRYGPCRARPRWRWITWGSVTATALWILGSLLFSYYIANFANYDATYGSLGAAVILLMWLYLGVYAILLGAALDSAMEHQTARDTTAGPEKPMGRRGAYVADTLGE